MTDKPVFPLTLYRITLETDCKQCMEDIIRHFSNPKAGYSDKWLYHQREHIIGVEKRERVRIKKK